jgi:RNA polymerase sigma factor (sigma-70 family)
MLRRRATETGSDAASPADDERLQRALDAALASLEREPRALLEAKYFASESVRALAERLNISEKALESRLARARNELRRALAKQLSRDE